MLTWLPSLSSTNASFARPTETSLVSPGCIGRTPWHWRGSIAINWCACRYSCRATDQDLTWCRTRHPNPAGVPGKPIIEAQQLRIQLAREVDVSHAQEVVAEVVVKLKHIAEIVGARETEAAVDIGGNGPVLHLLADRLGKSHRNLFARQVLAGDAYRLADELASLLQDSVGALADVLDGDARELPVSHG